MKVKRNFAHIFLHGDPLSDWTKAGCPSCRPTNIVKALKAVKRLFHLVMINECGWQQRSDGFTDQVDLVLGSLAAWH